MSPEDSEMLYRAGWEVECQSPLELRHRDGSVATRTAAEIVLAAVVTDRANPDPAEPTT